MKIFEILEDSWNLAKKNYKYPLLCAGIISLVVQIIVIAVPSIALSTADILTKQTNLSLMPVLMFFVIQAALLFVSMGISYAFLKNNQNIRDVGTHIAKNFHKILAVVMITTLAFVPFTVLAEIGRLLQLHQLVLLAIYIAVAMVLVSISIALQSAPLLILEHNESIIQSLKHSYQLVKTKFIEKTANYIGALFIATVVIGLGAFIVSAILSILGVSITKLLPNLSPTHVTTIEGTFKVIVSIAQQSIMMMAGSAILVTWYKKVTNP